jgi:transmembrane sensor
MRSVSAQFDRTDDIGRTTIEEVLARRSRKGRWFGGLAAGMFLLVGGGWLAAKSLTVQAWFPDHKTALGEQRAMTLDDGSGLILDTNAALNFRRDDTHRIVTLFRGQILARVAKDKAHPFVVETSDGTATALGTAFIVRRDDHGTTVTVIESTVRACPAKAGTEHCADLAPGDQVRMSQGGLSRVGRTNLETATMWTEGWLAANDQSVSQVLHELNRYRRKPVRFDPAELAGIRVSGSFPLAQPDRALEGIVRATGLHVVQAADGALLVNRTK